jgi:acid phosphatase (class A)
MKKILSLILVLSLSFSLYAEDKIKVYYTVEQLPDPIQFMPAPPDTLDFQFSQDVMRYFWGKQQRLNPERAAQARLDAIWTYEGLAAQFSHAFGLEISKDNTPEIWAAFTSGIETAASVRKPIKAYYHRMRPFVRFHEHILTYQAEEDEAELAGEGSYPSGHTMRGWATALLLAELNPDNADAIYKRGWDYGESRVIVGAHWQSDVDVSRAAASIGYAALHNSPAFRKQMEKAKAEYKKFTSKKEAK